MLSGTVTDPSGAFIPAASVTITNPQTKYTADCKTDQNGTYRFVNVPPNTYTLTVTAAGFASSHQTATVHAGIPEILNASLSLSEQVQSVDVTANAALVETETATHTDVDRNQFMKLPTFDPAAGLSDAITYEQGGVVADSNGSFHPQGDHGQTTYNFDGQPVSDQLSKAFSTQPPTNAFQSLEMVASAPGAEYGDKTSLIVNAVTRSGLGAPKMFGNLESEWSSFGTYGANASLGFGTAKFGEFIAIDGIRTGRFLDTPEITPIHDIGNNERIFDRLDLQPDQDDSLHLDLFVARNWFQVPNDYDQLSQDQRQRVQTWNVSPAWQHTFGPNALFSTNLFARRDQVDYYGSRDPFADTPVAVTQNRFLTNLGLRSDFSYVINRNEIKAGIQIQQTRLEERFTLGITDPSFNAPCLDASGNPLALPAITDPAACSTANSTYSANPNLQPGLLPFDLTRGGSYFLYHANGNINQYAFYLQDRLTLGPWTFNLGLRDDQYNGLTSANGLQPRLAASYLFKPSGTVLRASYTRTFETPFNENLLLSSGVGAGGLVPSAFGLVPQSIKPGTRNDYDTGFQQRIGKWAVLDGDYFWKYTHNAFDFNVLFNTPITFPISWAKSKLDGFTSRLTTTDWHGLQAYVTLGHTRARFFPPEIGGLIPQGGVPTSVFRIDHDQEFESNTSLRYQRPNNGEYISFIWRFDSGEVDGAVPDIASALALDADQQQQIGFYCGSTFATPGHPITTCPSGGGATLVRIPAPGTENDDTNPPRIAPRNLFDLSIGTDNLFHAAEKQPRITVALSVINLTNKVALYNFLSTFSGTHFIEPRTFEAHLGYVF